MPKSPLVDVFSHWHKAFDALQTSPLAFYSAVEAGLARRKVPGIATTRVDFNEGGIASAERTYLRVRRERLTFDICAAPFGTGFFFSWWLSERKPSRWAGFFLALFLLLAYVLTRHVVLKWLYPFGWTRILYFLPHGIVTAIVTVIVFLGVVVLVRYAMPQYEADLDAPLLATPLVSPLYAWMVKPVTLFKIDTTLMFQAFVHTAVLEVIDGLTTEKGMRALTEEERKPIMHAFLAR